MKTGQRIIVRTPDRHEYRGTLLETRSADGFELAVVRLDTGWVTTFPLNMVSEDARIGRDVSAGPATE